MTWLHRFTQVVVGATFLLVIAGGLVTSTGSGLSVPDWPTSYGWSMFTFPLSRWVGGIVYEHGHRLIASMVGLLTIIMVIAYWRTEPRKWVRWLTVVALGAIVAQGLLGGLTVLTKLPPAVSAAHAGLAEIFFVLTVALAVFTSRGWAVAYDDGPRAVGSAPALAADRGLRRLSVVAIAVVYVQILLGAVMRHTGAGLAIPDFPLMFGRLLPPAELLAIPGVAIHFAHRVGALLVAACLAATAWRVVARHGDRREIVRPALLLLALVVLQITLGGLTVLSERNVVINTAHLAVGALIFALTVVLALRVHRPHFATGVVGAASRPTATRVPAGTTMMERNAES
jgi:cytochrome c oxidase assembly protein subunit 15